MPTVIAAVLSPSRSRPRGRGWKVALRPTSCRRCATDIRRGQSMRHQPGYTLCEACGHAASL